MTGEDVYPRPVSQNAAQLRAFLSDSHKELTGTGLRKRRCNGCNAKTIGVRFDNRRCFHAGLGIQIAPVVDEGGQIN